METETQIENLAVKPACEALKKRKDFLLVAKGFKQRTEGFLLQGVGRNTEKSEAKTIRFGITCSKKLGNAVTRNRAKRRLRHLALNTLPDCGEPGWDYVLVGLKDTTTTLKFDQMIKDLKHSLNKMHRRIPT